MSEMVREQIEARGVRDERVLDAMRRIPRDRFVPKTVAHRAFHDSALPVGCQQTISQPYIVASMTEALAVEPSHRVLEIGTGTGYQTAVLCLLARQVYTIERHEELAAEARIRLAELGLSNAFLLVADGSVGWPCDGIRFDRILVTAAAPAMVKPLFEQLLEGGRLILPMGPEGDQRLVRIDRVDGRPVSTDLYSVRFVRLIGKAGYAE